jgi:hypothetical protein
MVAAQSLQQVFVAAVNAFNNANTEADVDALDVGYFDDGVSLHRLHGGTDPRQYRRRVVAYLKTRLLRNLPNPGPQFVPNAGYAVDTAAGTVSGTAAWTEPAAGVNQQIDFTFTFRDDPDDGWLLINMTGQVLRPID